MLSVLHYSSLDTWHQGRNKMVQHKNKKIWKVFVMITKNTQQNAKERKSLTSLCQELVLPDVSSTLTNLPGFQMSPSECSPGWVPVHHCGPFLSPLSLPAWLCGWCSGCHRRSSSRQYSPRCRWSDLPAVANCSPHTGYYCRILWLPRGPCPWKWRGRGTLQRYRLSSCRWYHW